jgi:serine/threonine protein kinase
MSDVIVSGTGIEPFDGAAGHNEQGAGPWQLVNGEATCPRRAPAQGAAGGSRRCYSRPMRVLAADDDEPLVRVLDRCLRRWGYEPLLARSGTEAWRMLTQEDAPRVVILDWDMPGLSGLEVCRMLRATPDGANAYVLMLTGRLEKESLIEALESGADDFLSKPFEPRELQLRLAKGIRDSARRSTSVSRPASGAPPSGSTLGGKYRLERKIGEGGMGSVWLGVHLSLGINVAIKFMARHLAETSDYASFEREARAAAQLRSEHIVRVYDHGITHDGLPYLVMEYLAGESLAAWIEQRGPLPPEAVASLVEQTARALTEAHGRGVVHRDVKPDNILMMDDAERPQGFVARLIDFGLAKSWRARVAADAPADDRVLRAFDWASEMVGDAGRAHGWAAELSSASAAATSVVAGTPCYMSPECLSASVAPNPLLDLWGLAVTAFFAMTGKLPFEGENVFQLHHRMCAEPLPVPSQVSPGLTSGFDAWFALACAPDPKTRFQSAAELAAALSIVCRKSVYDAESAPGIVKGFRSFAPTEPDTDVNRGAERQPRSR